MGPIACLETSVRNYHYIFRNIPEEGRSQLPITSFVKFFGPLTVKYRLSIIAHNKMCVNIFGTIERATAGVRFGQLRTVHLKSDC